MPFIYDYGHALCQKKKANEILLRIMDTTYVVAVAVKWPEPEFTCQLNGSATVQRESTRVREASEGLCGAEFCGLVASYYAMLSQHQSTTNSHQIRRRTCSLTKELTFKWKKKERKHTNLSMFLPEKLYWTTMCNVRPNFYNVE